MMAFVFSSDQWLFFLILYGFTQIFGLLQILAEEGFRQQSRLANLLHMVSNRTAFSLMCLALTVLHPTYKMPLFLLYILDFAAHWYQY